MPVVARGDCRVSQALLYAAVPNDGKLLAEGFDGGQGGEATLGAVAMHRNVLLDECVKQQASVRGEISDCNEVISQRTLLVEHPGIHRRDQLVGADEVHLHGKDAEKEVAISGGSGHS